MKVLFTRDAMVDNVFFGKGQEAEIADALFNPVSMVSMEKVPEAVEDEAETPKPQEQKPKTTPEKSGKVKAEK